MLPPDLLDHPRNDDFLVFLDPLERIAPRRGWMPRDRRILTGVQIGCALAIINTITSYQPTELRVLWYGIGVTMAWGHVHPMTTLIASSAGVILGRYLINSEPDIQKMPSISTVMIIAATLGMISGGIGELLNPQDERMRG